MFDLADKPVVWIPVTWDVLFQPDGDGEVAKTKQQSIDLLVEIVDRQELRKLFSGMRPDDDTTVYPDIPEIERFTRIVSDWRKVVSNKKPLPFNPENAEKLLNVAGFNTAFVTAYMMALSGAVETREGNSEPSGSNGPPASP